MTQLDLPPFHNQLATLKELKRVCLGAVCIVITPIKRHSQGFCMSLSMDAKLSDLFIKQIAQTKRTVHSHSMLLMLT